MISNTNVVLQNLLMWWKCETQSFSTQCNCKDLAKVGLCSPCCSLPLLLPCYKNSHFSSLIWCGRRPQTLPSQVLKGSLRFGSVIEYACLKPFLREDYSLESLYWNPTHCCWGWRLEAKEQSLEWDALHQCAIDYGIVPPNTNPKLKKRVWGWICIKKCIDMEILVLQFIPVA